MKPRSHLPNLSSHVILGALILAEGVVSVASARPLQSEAGGTLIVAALETTDGPRTAAWRAAAPLVTLFRRQSESRGRGNDLSSVADWNGFLDGLIVPAPEIPVRVSPPYIPPQVRLATRAEHLVALPLEAPALEAPPLGFDVDGLAESWRSDGIVDAPAIEIRVAAPEVPRVLELEGPGLEAPVLEVPELQPPPLGHR